MSRNRKDPDWTVCCGWTRDGNVRISNSGHGGNCCSNWAQLLKEKVKKINRGLTAAAAAVAAFDFWFCKLHPAQRVRARDGEDRVTASGRHFSDGYVQMRNADERRRALNQCHHVDFCVCVGTEKKRPGEREKRRASAAQQIIVARLMMNDNDDDDDDRYTVHAFLLDETTDVPIVITVNIIPG